MAQIPVELFTNHLRILSPPREQDDSSIAEMLSNPIEMKYLTAMSKIHCGGWSISDARNRRLDQEQNQLQGKGWNCVATLKTGEFVGICGLRTIDHWNKSGEMGICMKQEYWGRNFCAEIHLAILQCAFEELGLNRITFVTSSLNTPMIQFCQRILFATHEATLRDFFPHPSLGFESAELYSILASEWEKAKESLIHKLTV